MLFTSSVFKTVYKKHFIVVAAWSMFFKWGNRDTDFVICTGSQRTTVIVQKHSRPPDLSSHIQSYLSHVMIFQNMNFNLPLSLQKPRYVSLQSAVRCSGEHQTDWSYVFNLTSAWTPRSQLHKSFHTGRYGLAPVCILSQGPADSWMRVSLCSDSFCSFRFVTHEVQHVGSSLQFILYLKSWQSKPINIFPGLLVMFLGIFRDFQLKQALALFGSLSRYCSTG